MAGNPYLVKSLTVPGRGRGDPDFEAAINAHLKKNDSIIASGQKASPHAQQARTAAWDAHDAASKQAQDWANIRAEQQEMRNELKILEQQVKKLQNTK